MEKKYVNYVEFCHINYLFIKLGDKLNKIMKKMKN